MTTTNVSLKNKSFISMSDPWEEERLRNIQTVQDSSIEEILNRTILMENNNTFKDLLKFLMHEYIHEDIIPFLEQGTLHYKTTKKCKFEVQESLFRLFSFFGLFNDFFGYKLQETENFNNGIIEPLPDSTTFLNKKLKDK